MSEASDDSKASEWAKRWLRNYFNVILWIFCALLVTVLVAGIGTYVAFSMHANAARDRFSP